LANFDRLDAAYNQLNDHSHRNKLIKHKTMKFAHSLQTTLKNYKLVLLANFDRKDAAYNQYNNSLRSITKDVPHEQMHARLESYVHKLPGQQKQATAGSTKSVVEES
jgi:hypothetical protein